VTEGPAACRLIRTPPGPIPARSCLRPARKRAALRFHVSKNLRSFFPHWSPSIHLSGGAVLFLFLGRGPSCSPFLRESPTFRSACKCEIRYIYLAPSCLVLAVTVLVTPPRPVIDGSPWYSLPRPSKPAIVLVWEPGITPAPPLRPKARFYICVHLPGPA